MENSIILLSFKNLFFLFFKIFGLMSPLYGDISGKQWSGIKKRILNFFRLYTKIGVLLHFYSVFRIIHEKVRVSELQYSIFLRSYLKIRERKKLERKKVRAQPLSHLNNPPTNPFDLLDISMLLYHKETGRLDGE